MGDIKLKQKQYNKPRNLYDGTRIKQENELVRKYGLKNKKEIWKADSEISRIRRRAKNLINASEEEQKEFFERLNNLGLGVSSTADVLALTGEDLLKRRLQTFLVKKGFVNSPRQARQLIVHKHVMVNGCFVNSPSYTITKELEDKISVKEKKQNKDLNKETVKQEEDAEQTSDNAEDKENKSNEDKE